jgi:hypothetical protein
VPVITGPWPVGIPVPELGRVPVLMVVEDLLELFVVEGLHTEVGRVKESVRLVLPDPS